MTIDKYKQEDGAYVDPSGCHWHDAESFLQGYVLGFCCCGSPSTNLAYVRDCLLNVAKLCDIRDRTEGRGQQWEKEYHEWEEERSKLMGNARYFTLYVLDQKGFIEHGGSVGGGWLTDKGKDMLADLEDLLK
ncbi:MAG: hypothetical protein E6Q97_22605 [Desulfurellales bacterium]|nr:MAG: hypothetical protein E6Q97_22605 [Desulfurellales bacterium]